MNQQLSPKPFLQLNRNVKLSLRCLAQLRLKKTKYTNQTTTMQTPLTL